MRGLADLHRFRIDTEGHIVTVTITAPPVNAQDRRLREECVRIFDVLGAETDVRAIVLTGDGRTFSAGADFRNGERCWRSPAATRGTIASSAQRSAPSSNAPSR